MMCDLYAANTPGALWRLLLEPPASALEWALEGLHLSRRLNKDSAGRAGTYRYEGLGRSR